MQNSTLFQLVFVMFHFGDYKQTILRKVQRNNSAGHAMFSNLSLPEIIKLPCDVAVILFATPNEPTSRIKTMPNR